MVVIQVVQVVIDSRHVGGGHPDGRWDMSARMVDDLPSGVRPIMGRKLSGIRKTPDCAGRI